MSDDDRTVHAFGEVLEVVRYDRAGKWYIESKVGQPRQAVTIKQAVSIGDNLWRNGGSINFGRKGGSTFDRMVRARYTPTTKGT